MKIETNKIFCLNCASIFLDEKKDELVCSVCGNKIDREKYESLVDYSYDAVSYGYLYRNEYQSQIYNLKPVRLYWIETEEIIVYCALAALSGVIGNATYDFVKYLIQKIRKQHHKAYPSDNLGLFENDKEVLLFFQYLKEYYNGLEGVNFVVRKMIDMEIRADNHSLDEPDKYLEEPKKARIEKLKGLFRKSRKKQSPWELKDLNPSDFENLWNYAREKQEATRKSTNNKKSKPKNKSIKSAKTKKHRNK